jgi:hypothetical protein
MPRPCTVCSHPNRDKIDEALLSGTAIRDVAGQHDLRKSAVDRHRSHIGTLLAEAGQRQAELEADHGDDLLGQVKSLTRDLRQALEDAKQAKSLSAFLQVTDRLQKQAALQAQLLERAEVVGPHRYVLRWQYCPHHPNEDCPALAKAADGSNGGRAIDSDAAI